MNSWQIDFLERVRDRRSIYLLTQTHGYGWAIEAGLIREVRPSPPFLDFAITDAGREALRRLNTKGD